MRGSLRGNLRGISTMPREKHFVVGSFLNFEPTQPANVIRFHLHAHDAPPGTPSLAASASMGRLSSFCSP